MADLKNLSPKAKKTLIYGGLGVVGLGMVTLATMQTSAKPTIREPEAVSLTGNADTRSVSIEGLNRRLADLETGGQRDSISLREEVTRLQTNISNLSRSLEEANKNQQTAINRAVEAALASKPTTITSNDLVAKPRPTTEATRNSQAPVAAPTESEADRNARMEREKAENTRNESIYVAPEPPPISAARTGAQAAPAPRIAVYGAKLEEKQAAKSDLTAHIPDVQIPAGSILSAYLLTGLDAPTGNRASSQPVPVLMRIKKEAILPNYAWADVTDCHLLGSAFGDLGSERVNIRGETVSCVLRDNTAVEGAVKFYVTGEDGKNGIKGTLVSRSGRILAAAAGAALAQGLLSSLDKSSTESVFLGGGGGGGGGAMDGASKGFDLLTEYYLDLAEQTFPVLEVTNGRWVDVVVTEMLTIKFKG